MSDKFNAFKERISKLSREELEQFSPEQLAKIRDTLKAGRLPSERNVIEQTQETVKENISDPVGAFTKSAFLGFTEPVLRTAKFVGLDPIGVDEFAARNRAELARDFPGNEIAKKAGSVAGASAALLSSGPRGALTGAAKGLFKLGKAIVKNPAAQTAGALGAINELSNPGRITEFTKKLID